MLVFNWDKIGIDSISDDKVHYAPIQVDANMFLDSNFNELHRNLVMSLMPQFEQYTDDKTCFVFELCNAHNLDEDDLEQLFTIASGLLINNYLNLQEPAEREPRMSANMNMINCRAISWLKLINNKCRINTFNCIMRCGDYSISLIGG